MLLIPGRIRVAMQVAANHSLRLIPLRHLHGRHTALSSDERIETQEIDELRAEAERLRYDGVVVAVLREMAVAARLRFGLALRVRVVRIHRLRAVTRRSDRRLLHVDALAIRVRTR